MDSNKKPKNSCSWFPFNIFESRRRPRGPRQDKILHGDVGSGKVWTRSTDTGGVREAAKAGSRVSDHHGSYVDRRAEKYIDKFYENYQYSDVEVEKV